MRHLRELSIQRTAPDGQPARGLLRVLAQDGHRPPARRDHRVVEPGDLLRAEQHERGVQRDRGERADGHRVAGTGGDHHDAAGELARRPPERARVDAGRVDASWVDTGWVDAARVDAARVDVARVDVARVDVAHLGRTRVSEARTTPPTAHSVPPYRYHLAAVELAMITLPLATGMDSTNEAAIQPIAGTSAPLTARRAEAASRQVARIATQNAIAASGTGPVIPLYRKLPSMPCTTPNRNSTP